MTAAVFCAGSRKSGHIPVCFRASGKILTPNHCPLLRRFPTWSGALPESGSRRQGGRCLSRELPLLWKPLFGILRGLATSVHGTATCPESTLSFGIIASRLYRKRRMCHGIPKDGSTPFDIRMRMPARMMCEEAQCKSRIRARAGLWKAAFLLCWMAGVRRSSSEGAGDQGGTCLRKVPAASGGKPWVSPVAPLSGGLLPSGMRFALPSCAVQRVENQDSPVQVEIHHG